MFASVAMSHKAKKISNFFKCKKKKEKKEDVE